MSVETNIIACGPWRPQPKPLIRPPEPLPLQLKHGCKTDGCSGRMYCRGLCRVCYNREWNARRAGPKTTVLSAIPAKKRDQIERDLREARLAYGNAIGVECRIRWRRKIDLFEQELDSLGEEEQCVAGSSEAPVSAS